MLMDAAGQNHAALAADAQPRIVSLVPSITELLCDLGLAHRIVGRTGFCIHPADLVRDIPKIGGTKDVNIEKIRTLAPTHLIVNIDENTKPTADARAAFIPHVIVTHPQTPRDNLDLYRLLGGIFGAESQAGSRANALCRAFEHAHAALALQSRPAPRTVLYCIWQDPWMTVSKDTYIANMLAQIGWHVWQAPTPERYPAFDWSPSVVDAIDAVLLSTEPYRFTETHVDALERQIGKPVQLVDGEMLSWYGSRAIAGLRYLHTLAA
jgi:ABC-type Fe3+-hydroxamate transport system substrate-binding protein